MVEHIGESAIKKELIECAESIHFPGNLQFEDSVGTHVQNAEINTTVGLFLLNCTEKFVEWIVRNGQSLQLYTPTHFKYVVHG